MPRELLAKRKLEIIRGYFRGESYDDIARRLGVAKGSVVNVIQELRSGRFPQVARAEEVELLREAAVTLRKLDLDPWKAVVGLDFFRRLNELGLEPKDLDAWATMCGELSPDELQREEFVQAALRLHRLKRESGRDYHEIVDEAEQLGRKAGESRREVTKLNSELQKLPELVAARQRELDGLDRRKEKIQETVDTLSRELDAKKKSTTIADQALQVVQNQLETRQNEVTLLHDELASLQTAIASRRRDLQELEANGIDDEQLRRIKVALETLATATGSSGTELAGLLVEGVETEGEVLRLQAEKARLTREVASMAKAVEKARTSEKTHLGQVAALSQQKAELEGYIHTLKATVIKDVDAITAAARDGIAETSRGAGEGVEQATHDVRRLAKRATEVGEQIGGLQGTVSSLRWVGLLQKFLIDPASLTPEEWRELMPLLIPALKAGIEQHSPAIPSAELLLKILSRLPEELDGGPK